MGEHTKASALRYRIELARFISLQGRLDEADELFREILDEHDIDDESQHERLNLYFAGHLVAIGQFEGAEARALDVLETSRSFGPGGWRAHETYRVLIDLCVETGRTEEAARWRARLDDHGSD